MVRLQKSNRYRLPAGHAAGYHYAQTNTLPFNTHHYFTGKDNGQELKVNEILAKYPGHKRVAFFKMKIDKREAERSGTIGN